ncbi:uncharacterized protein TNIN_498271 [Trichonephila inaurata madagascariensis]|uniref:Uncharacterized protein n=1 Tax=Trichonephila inaurata madagascariensis TaxID=2747483 RepID=A0A8X6X882_9ARAC|nr:uncharacterized protein TNIN_498271 [Trichonephila inaurata madagascariensis]
MAYLGKGRIAELRYIAKQLGEKVTDDLKIIDLKNLIVNSLNYEEEFVREMLNMIIEKRLKTSTSRVSKYFDLNERYILSTYELETLFKLKKHNSSIINKVNSKSENVSLDPCTIRSKENGVVMPVLRETGASLDMSFEKYAAPEIFTGEHASIKYIDDDTMTYLPPTEREIECELRHVVSKPVVSAGHLDLEKYFLEGNTRLAVRPAECELVQDGVEYRGHVVGLGKQSSAQLKVRAIIDLSISRYKTQVKVLGLAEYYRQYIPMFSCLVTPVTETLKRKSKKGDIKWTSECPEFFRQLEENLSTNSYVILARRESYSVKKIVSSRTLVVSPVDN